MLLSKYQIRAITASLDAKCPAKPNYEMTMACAHGKVSGSMPMFGGSNPIRSSFRGSTNGRKRK